MAGEGDPNSNENNHNTMTNKAGIGQKNGAAIVAGDNGIRSRLNGTGTIQSEWEQSFSLLLYPGSRGASTSESKAADEQQGSLVGNSSSNSNSNNNNNNLEASNTVEGARQERQEGGTGNVEENEDDKSQNVGETVKKKARKNSQEKTKSSSNQSSSLPEPLWNSSNLQQALAGQNNLQSLHTQQQQPVTLTQQPQQQLQLPQHQQPLATSTMSLPTALPSTVQATIPMPATSQTQALTTLAVADNATVSALNPNSANSTETTDNYQMQLQLLGQLQRHHQLQGQLQLLEQQQQQQQQQAQLPLAKVDQIQQQQAGGDQYQYHQQQLQKLSLLQQQQHQLLTLAAQQQQSQQGQTQVATVPQQSAQAQLVQQAASQALQQPMAAVPLAATVPASAVATSAPLLQPITAATTTPTASVLPTLLGQTHATPGPVPMPTGTAGTTTADNLFLLPSPSLYHHMAAPAPPAAAMFHQFVIPSAPTTTAVGAATAVSSNDISEHISYDVRKQLGVVGGLSDNFAGVQDRLSSAHLEARNKNGNDSKNLGISASKCHPQHHQVEQSAAATGNHNSDRNEGSGRTTQTNLLLSLPCDADGLSSFQCLLRKQIELFEAKDEDVLQNAKGRNKPIVLGQVGIRCKHCSQMNPKKRAGGSTYYPGTLLGIYQSAQKMGVLHICGNCSKIPLDIKQELCLSRDEKSSSGSGKRYWADAAKALGVYEDESKGCLRFSINKEDTLLRNSSAPSDTAATRTEDGGN